MDLRLYLVTDAGLCAPRSVVDVVRAGVAGGVTAVQLRDKQGDTATLVALARQLKAALAPLGVPLIVNDRVDVALAADADGVHVGQSDLPFSEARRMMGPGRIVGLSVENMDQLCAAEGLDADYLGISPVFCTPTKAELTTAWGLDGLARARSLSRHRLVAIGGINLSNAARVIGAGADGLAVVSAICCAADPEQAARELRRCIA